MQLRPFDINYRSAEKFFHDYLQLKEGELFVRAEDPLPKNTQLALNITVPRIDYAFQINGVVMNTRDLQTAKKVEKPPGMVVRIAEDLDPTFQKLEPKLRADEKFQFLLALCDTIADSRSIIAYDTIEEEPLQGDKNSPGAAAESTAIPGWMDFGDQTAAGEAVVGQPPGLKTQTEGRPPEPKAVAQDTAATTHASGINPVSEVSHEVGSARASETCGEDDSDLTFEWLRDAVAQEEATVEEAPAPEIAAPPTQDKRNLTSQEREKIKPAADFIMDFTKAMLRSGYYSTEHPGSLKAKQGLFHQFQDCLGESQEIMVTNLESREKTDILITGILDEPVSVRTLVGSGMAELFVPKLRDYFNRKGLISFAIKKQITAAHFESYIDIMSDPRVDRGENKKMGELLSRALAKHGITEISTVFMDDIIVLEKNLPWRVEMAIQRLTKDLKVLPMFREKSDQAILDLKVKIIHDIIRPLKYGQYIKELLVNCYIIAKHVENIKSEEIEEIIIEGVPAKLLLPTSQHVFDELKDLTELRVKQPASDALNRRHGGVKRIIKSMSLRMIQLKVEGVQSFLEELHHSGVLAFEELPPDVQYLVNTMKMVRDVKARTRVYIGWIFERRLPDDAKVMLKCFRRVMPVILEEEHWNIAFKLTLAVDKVKNETELYSPQNGLPSNPFPFVFKDVTDLLAGAYLRLPTASRLKIDQIVRRLEDKGIDILNQIITQSESSETRADAMETIVNMGEMARRWSLNALATNEPAPGKVKNALAILRDVGKVAEDTEAVRKLVGHHDPQVQEEALHTLMSFNAEGLDQFIVKALDSSDDKLRWRAVSALGNLGRFSKGAIREVLAVITSDPPEDEQQAAAHGRKIAQLIQALAAINNFPALDRLEEAILKAVLKTVESSKGFITRLKRKNSKADQTPVLVAAFTTLGKIGSSKSIEFLSKFSKGKSALALEAQKALTSIKARETKNALPQT